MNATRRDTMHAGSRHTKTLSLKSEISIDLKRRACELPLQVNAFDLYKHWFVKTLAHETTPEKLPFTLKTTSRQGDFSNE
jgi:hypothetical protein